MILTFTPNPSIDLTLGLNDPLRRGHVQRLSTVTRVAGGKGVNVGVATHRAGEKTLALFPSPTEDPFIKLIAQTAVPFEHIHNEGAVRTNTTVMELDGTTTKLNGPGAALTPLAKARAEKRLLDCADEADWVVLAGSLPPEAPLDWYSELTAMIRQPNPSAKVAVDTSDKPLEAVAERLDDIAPTLLKPNGFELGILAGIDGAELEAQAAAGHYDTIVAAARKLCDRGVELVLVTLGGSGAVLVTADTAIAALPPRIDVVSTVGAGDCSLAGFVLGNSRGKSLAESLKLAVAYGSAAAALPGTQIPFPEVVHPESVLVSTL